MLDIVELDEAMSYQRDKAILWFLESAPFRAGTVRKLFWRDLKSTAELLRVLVTMHTSARLYLPLHSCRYVLAKYFLQKLLFPCFLL